MISQKPVSSRFIFLLITLCLFYLGFEFFWNHYSTLSVDEFWFAHRIYQYKDTLPYRDFAPYKTILGYYLLLPSILPANSIMQTLIVSKDIITLINSLILFFSTFWLTRFFPRFAVLSSLAIIVTAQMVLSFSTQIRVDLFGYWFCFFSILLLFEKRYFLAGILLGLGFATTQKSVWYIFATNGALLLQWLLFERRIKNIIPLFIINFSCACVIGIYLIFWAYMSDWHTVLNSVFGEGSIMYHLTWYDSARELFWQSIILYNPLPFLLWPVTFFSLFITYPHDKHYSQRFFVIAYSSIILFCLIPYKQIFPYYTQVTIPIFFILYTAFASWLFDIFKSDNLPHLIISKKILWNMLAIYLVILALLFGLLDLPISYLLISIVPISIYIYVSEEQHIPQEIRELILKVIFLTIACVGFIFPYSLLPSKIISTNGAYQKANINAVSSLIADGSDYVAGIELIFNRNQPISGLRHLMGPAIDYLQKPTAELKTVMLASLYEDPDANISSVLNALSQSSVKLYVNNYRMRALPKPLLDYLHSQYEHWWGSIYLYAPSISPEKQTIALKFPGKYLIECDPEDQVGLDGKYYSRNEIVTLTKKTITTQSKSNFRLKLIPEINIVNTNYIHDDWYKLLS